MLSIHPTYIPASAVWSLCKRHPVDPTKIGWAAKYRALCDESEGWVGKPARIALEPCAHRAKLKDGTHRISALIATGAGGRLIPVRFLILVPTIPPLPSP